MIRAASMLYNASHSYDAPAALMPAEALIPAVGGGTCIMLLLVAVSVYMPSGERLPSLNSSPEGIYTENMQ